MEPYAPLKMLLQLWLLHAANNKCFPVGTSSILTVAEAGRSLYQDRALQLLCPLPLKPHIRTSLPVAIAQAACWSDWYTRTVENKVK